ncbi:DUF5086 family protein [Brucella intermedia]|uniref:DUF5086 family protein n=1 Tax=Brucella intermedia TaxID=94625 RepID=UPI0022870102|nr:DUF5086 family protein [Brucella intermedia]
MWRTDLYKFQPERPDDPYYHVRVIERQKKTGKSGSSMNLLPYACNTKRAHSERCR